MKLNAEISEILDTTLKIWQDATVDHGKDIKYIKENLADPFTDYFGCYIDKDCTKVVIYKVNELTKVLKAKITNNFNQLSPKDKNAVLFVRAIFRYMNLSPDSGSRSAKLIAIQTNIVE